MNFEEILSEVKFEVKFGDEMLAPAIVQDADKHDVLMLAWMNQEALRRTVECGEMVFWSRSRKEYWHKGDTSGTVNFAQPFSYFYMDNLLTADLRFGGTTLRLGYHGTVLSTEVHHIVCNMTTHNFLIGIANEWVTLSPRKKISDSAKVISSIY